MAWLGNRASNADGQGPMNSKEVSNITNNNNNNNNNGLDALWLLQPIKTLEMTREEGLQNLSPQRQSFTEFTQF